MRSFVVQERFNLVQTVAHSVQPKEEVGEPPDGLPEKPDGEADYNVRMDNSEEQSIQSLNYRAKEEVVGKFWSNPPETVVSVRCLPYLEGCSRRPVDKAW